MPSCLVTGGAGFIGSHLVTELVERGWQVRVLDDFSAGKRSNLAHVDGYQLYEGSILDASVVQEAVAGVDVVFHLAALVSVPESVQRPADFHHVCATGTLQLLIACRDAKVRRMVYSASSSAYGETGQHAIKENSPLQPMSPYAAAKLAGEHYCSAMSAVSDLETVRLRYFNVFGPRQDPSSPYSGVISIFCTRMLQGQQPGIYGDGLQTRDFVSVHDVVQANCLAAEKPGVSGKVFNIGSGRRVSLLNLCDAINGHLGTTLEPVFMPPRAGDIRHSFADISAAQEHLGYSPQISFEQGLSECLGYYRQELLR